MSQRVCVRCVDLRSERGRRRRREDGTEWGREEREFSHWIWGVGGFVSWSEFGHWFRIRYLAIDIVGFGNRCCLVLVGSTGDVRVV